MSVPIQGSLNECGLQVIGHRPANDATAEKIKDDGLIQPTIVCVQIRDIGYPFLVRFGRIEVTIEHIGGHWVLQPAAES